MRLADSKQAPFMLLDCGELESIVNVSAALTLADQPPVDALWLYRRNSAAYGCHPAPPTRRVSTHVTNV